MHTFLKNVHILLINPFLSNYLLRLKNENYRIMVTVKETI